MHDDRSGVGGDFDGVSICQVLLLCEIINIEVRLGSLLLFYVGRFGEAGYCMVRGGMVTMGMTLGCCSGLEWWFYHSSCMMVFIVVELNVDWVASVAQFMVLGRSIFVMWAYPWHAHLVEKV